MAAISQKTFKCRIFSWQCQAFWASETCLFQGGLYKSGWFWVIAWCRTGDQPLPEPMLFHTTVPVHLRIYASPGGDESPRPLYSTSVAWSLITDREVHRHWPSGRFTNWAQIQDVDFTTSHVLWTKYELICCCIQHAFEKDSGGFAVGDHIPFRIVESQSRRSTHWVKQICCSCFGEMFNADIRLNTIWYCHLKRHI